MTQLSDGTIVTDIQNDTANRSLASQGYSVRHIETYHDHDNQSFIHWDCPRISEDDLPY